MTARKPNVLFIITDQQRADHTGFMGNDIVQTPHLDALASRGMVFENAWVANPVCMPNRSSLMTGRMPTAHGVIFNDRSLEWGAATHVRQFREAGWRTALIGKSHLQHGLSRNSVVPVDRTATVDHGYSAGWDQLEDDEIFGTSAADAAAPEWPEDFYGFGHVELSIDHGARITGHHLLWALDRGARYEDLVVPMSSESPAKRRSDRWWQIYQPPYGEEFHSTNFVAEQTIAFIDDAVEANEPWYAWASFPDPHHPMTPPGQWYDRHDASEIELPPSIDDELTNAPDYLRRFQQVAAADQRGWVSPFGATDPELVREATAATYGAVEFIDDAVGRILESIDDHGDLDNTIVVFTSDHGDMMGDHGLMTKGFMPFRGTQQVNLVIDDPRRPAGRSASLASSIDLGPTLMDLCAVPVHDGVQGSSLAPTLDDPTVATRDHLLIEDDVGKSLSRLIRIPHRIRTLVADDGMKLTRYGTGETMLFDLTNDPYELNELSHRDRARTTVANERLLDAMIELTDDARGAPVL